MLWEVDVHARDAAGDHAARAVVAGATELGVAGCTRARTAAGWLIEGDLSRADVERLAAAVLVDPLDTASIADGILRVIEQRDALSARARDRAVQLSWKRSAQLTREVYAEAIADGPRMNKGKR